MVGLWSLLAKKAKKSYPEVIKVDILVFDHSRRELPLASQQKF